jgi:hypothetical protein
MRVETPFKPSVHGWPFRNSFPFNLLQALRIPYGAKTGKYGFCGGMCATALDRYHRGDSVDRALRLPAQGEPLYREILERQVKSLGGTTVLRVYGWQVMANRGSGVGAWTLREWERLKQSLDAGRPEVLCLVRGKGWSPLQLDDNHQVVAHAYEVDPAVNRVTVYIYDPNRPGRDDQSLTFKRDAPDGKLDLKEHDGPASGPELYGFFVMDYRKPA